MFTSRPTRIGGAVVALTLFAGSCSDDGGADDAATDDEPAGADVTEGDASIDSTSDDGPSAAPGSAGLIDETTWSDGVDDYLRFATETPLEPGEEVSPNRVLADVLSAERDPAHEWDPSAVTVDTFASSFTKLDDWKDTGDFDLMYLINLIEAGDDVLAPEVVEAIEQRMIDFRYWYDDPLPADRLDHKWFWSENHRIIFAVIEYLAGQRLPDTVFTVTGLTGAEHQERARERIVDWVAERAEYGFSEWHSNVYMQKNVVPLATLVQWVEDPELVALATVALDYALLDVAAHIQQGTYGATHGRSYQKDSWSGTAEDTWGLAKLVFADTGLPYQSTSDAGAVTLAMADRYRVPAVIATIGTSEEIVVVRERHGVDLDPTAPVAADPPHPEAHPFDDVPFWWSQGALTAWQVVPSVFAAAEEYRLWETDLFSTFTTVRDLTNDDVDTAQALAQQTAPFSSFGLLSTADTYTWRSDEAMLSSVIDHRVGHRRDQIKAWQATLTADAQVFTTHPGNPPQESDRFEDGDMYWTGSASVPRSIQHENVAVHAYDPLYAAPGPPLDELFGSLPETHAWFPTEHFDEVVQRDSAGGTWTFGRAGDGFVALWSMRPTTWRSHDPAATPTGELTEDFDLVAEGGADNVWIVEMGRAADGDFASFVADITAAPIAVEDLGDDLGAGFAVRYSSPSIGVLDVAADGTVTVDGGPVRQGGHDRLDAPWARWDGVGPLEIEWADETLRIDLVTGERSID